MSTVFVYVYPRDFLAVDVAAGMGTLVNDKATFAPAVGKMRECGSVKTGAHYQIIILFCHLLWWF